jgi:hypothetical protein
MAWAISGGMMPLPCRYPLTLTKQREPFIDYTIPYMDEGYGLLVRASTSQAAPATSFLTPFSGARQLPCLPGGRRCLPCRSDHRTSQGASIPGTCCMGYESAV